MTLGVRAETSSLLRSRPDALPSGRVQLSVNETGYRSSGRYPSVGLNPLDGLLCWVWGERCESQGRLSPEPARALSRTPRRACASCPETEEQREGN